MFGGLSQLFFWGVLLFILGNEAWEDIINYAGPLNSLRKLMGAVCGNYIITHITWIEHLIY